MASMFTSLLCLGAALFVASGCNGSEVSDETGMVSTDEEGDEIALAVSRADLELTASGGPVVDGAAQVTVGVRSLDETYVIGPAVRVVLSDGVSLAAGNESCVDEGAGLRCNLPSSISGGQLPTDVVELVVDVDVDSAAVDPSVTVIAESQYNPVENDPDPSNNTTTIQLLN